MENIGRNSDKLREIAKRVINERKINSVVRIDEDLLDLCSTMVNEKSTTDDSDDRIYALMASAIVKYRPIQRINPNPNTRYINEIFALTIVNDALDHKLNDPEYFSTKQESELMRNIFKYLKDGSSDVEAILCLIRCINTTF